MKKLYTLLYLFSFTISFADAQWVTIPDTNFTSFLQQQYPQCMNGNQMDTTCSAIVNETYIHCGSRNISDLSGLQYFTSLTYLNISNNQITSLPSLNFPLVFLNCNNNQITVLPSLPSTLIGLECNNNQLISLPSLPSSLEYFDCDANQLVTLPSLPLSLQILRCGSNPLTTLPVLPTTLTKLICYYTPLTTLPSLPASLIELNCPGNQLISLPALPSSLTKIWCQNNLLTSLPTLPASLKELVCYDNQLTSLPSLPASLLTINCSHNQLTTLPSLPTSLKELYCYYNQLISLPPLPGFLNFLSCFNNQITSLPGLPGSLKSLSCSNNLLSSIPELPDTLEMLLIQSNPNLTCLPELKNIEQYFSYANTGIHCLPNYPNVFGTNPFINPPLSTYPLCDIFNNPNNCDFFWNINGKVYGDANNNCINDTGEQGISNLKLQLFQNGNLIQQTYSIGEGTFSFDTDTGTFTYTVDTTNLPVLVTCPSSGFHTSVLTPLDSMDYNMNFAMQCKPGFDLGVKNIVRSAGQFFPADSAIVTINAGDMAGFYGLTCASGVSGSVIVDFTGPITFISEAPGALVPSFVGNTLTYTIPDFGLVNFNSDFIIILQTDTTAQVGNQVCFTVNVTPTTGDNNVSNNSMQHCFSVVNSFDPNAKEVYPEGGISLNQEWMTYTIHFQNTGNAPAQNIYILDTLDQNLIPETFTLLSYSHEPLTQLFGNVVKFNFPNINLPDSTNDEPNSHGFVQYKIKLTPGLLIGTTISNIAYNFFDFNTSVATNSVTNIVVVTSIVNNPDKFDFSVFPNPSSNEVNISFNLNSTSEIKIDLFNSLGQIVKSITKSKLPAGRNEINFSVADLPDGVYYLKAVINSQPTIKKIVKY